MMPEEDAEIPAAPVTIDTAEAEFLTLLKLEDKTLAQAGWPHQWTFSPFTMLWTKPGLKFTQGGRTIVTDHVLSNAYIYSLAAWNAAQEGQDEDTSR